VAVVTDVWVIENCTVDVLVKRMTCVEVMTDVDGITNVLVLVSVTSAVWVVETCIVEVLVDNTT
jgi:hypothetical protein